MAKELLIVFVYDCEMCQREEDDPQDAVVYFYPSWVSEQQRLALVGQLMGVSQFLNTVFSSPNIMALQTGKFAMKSVGRYTLCVGTDRNIPDVVLDTRITTLFQLLRFYHMDFETVLMKAKDTLSEKLHQVFETYLPILQYSSNIFGSIPTCNLPKSASSVFLEAMQVLQCFQNKPGVMGGVLLYQNKVVATQLSAKLTKLLVITDPYRIKLPAENVSTQFHLPVGVQLMTVYVELSEVETLRIEASQLNAALKSVNQRQKNSLNKDKPIAKVAPKEVSNPPAFGMKRDVSRIFTVLEEAEGEAEVEGEKVEVPDVVRDAVKAQKTARLLSVAPAAFVVPDPTAGKRAQTTDNIEDSCSRKHKIRYCSLGVPDEDKEGAEECIKLKSYFNTISDATFPLFRRNGLPASQSLFDSRLKRHYSELSKETVQEKKERPRSFVNGFNGLSEESQKKKERARKALNLPLSSTAADTKDMVPMTDFTMRKPNLNIPLTPLMAKLSLLAMEQKIGDITTPKAEKPPQTPLLPTRPIKKSRTMREREKKEIVPLEENVLYVCGYQNMTLLLLIDSQTSQDPEEIHSLWNMSVSSLSELETHLHHCLEHFPSNNGSESYSFLCVDPEWGTVQRGGAWAGARLELLTTMHQQFNTKPSLAETIVRSEDSTVYGYQCGGVQVFYQQGCREGVAGLPAPSDLIGVVSLKAKRRLERDHGIVLL